MGLWKEFVTACSAKPKKSSKGGPIQQPVSDVDASSTLSSQSSIPHVVKPPQAQQPAGVTIEFKASNGSQYAQQPASRSSTQSQGRFNSPEEEADGMMTAEGVYKPGRGFRTPALLQQMKEKYDIPDDEIRKAMDFAESKEYVDVYCFAYCITGGPMEPTAFKAAGLDGMDKEAILASASSPGMDGLKILTPEEQRRHDKARKDFLVQHALQGVDDDEASMEEDPEELVEAYREHFEKDTNDMGLEEVMVYFGVPEASKVAIHKALHPAKGAATATTDERARRKAAHSVALERFDELAS